MSSEPHPRPSDESDPPSRRPRTAAAAAEGNGRDLDYERNNAAPCDRVDSSDEDDGMGVKCKNHELCKNVNPVWWYECKGHYLCTACDMLFGTWGNPANRIGYYNIGRGALEFTDDLECSICLESKRSVSLPRCRHTLCIECFKRHFYGIVFPYPDVEDEYVADPENRRWRSADYPLIAAYLVDRRRLERAREPRKPLCPLCRQ